jgi:hypothetical protein
MEAGDQLFSCAMGPWNNGNYLVGCSCGATGRGSRSPCVAEAALVVEPRRRRHGIATNLARASEGVRGCVRALGNFRLSEKEIFAERFSADLCVAAAARPWPRGCS